MRRRASARNVASTLSVAFDRRFEPQCPLLLVLRLLLLFPLLNAATAFALPTVSVILFSLHKRCVSQFSFCRSCC